MPDLFSSRCVEGEMVPVSLEFLLLYCQLVEMYIRTFS